MKIKRHQVIIAGIIILGLTFLIIGVLYQRDPVKYYAHSLRTWQEADSVAGYPIAINGKDEGSPQEFHTTGFQPNLSTLSPMERYRIPRVRGFSRFPDPDARAAATGLVLYTGNPSGYSGRTILLGHRLSDGSIVQTFYTGLTSVKLRVGQHVARGASLGTGGGLTEVRAGSSIDIASEEIAGFTLNSQDHPQAPNRLPLDAFFDKHGLSNSTPDPLALIQENELRAAREKIQIKTK